MMGRPTSKRRLRDIDPDVFGRDVADLLEDHLTLLLGVDKDASRVIRRRATVIGKEASSLARYACGVALDHEQACDALFAVQVWLFSCCAHELDTAIEMRDLFPSDDIGIVLLASHARIRLHRGEAVPVRELACLAGVDPDHVRLLARQGEITIAGGAIAPRIAQQWLETRGIAAGTTGTCV